MGDTGPAELPITGYLNRPSCRLGEQIEVSTRSITFLGSLWRNGFEGPVSRPLENVVRRFTRI